MAYDLLIKNARIIDGAGNPWFKADIGVKSGKVSSVGNLDGAMAIRTIDGSGYVASPGFIDIHTHSEFPLLIDGHAHSKIRQGVTLEITNHCGGWGAPLKGVSLDQAYRTVRRYDPDFVIDWENMNGYMERLERQGVSLNAGCLVGHGAVRSAVFGFEDRAPSAEELSEMLRLIRVNMDMGCFGISTGIYYAPGSYAALEEFAECCRVVADYGGIHATHVRDESNYNIGLVASIKEVVEISRRSGVRTQIAHIKGIGPASAGKSEEVVGILDDARYEGVDITADQYPYTASGSSITGSLVPRWAQAGGRDTMVARLKDKETREKIKGEMTANYARRGGADKLMVALCPMNRAYEGKSMREVAEMMGVCPSEAACRILEVADVPFVSHVIQESDLITYMKWGGVVVGSDGSSLATSGPLGAGSPHPRNFGTFPRVLARYVREKKVITLQEAIRRMTSATAQRLGLKDRGLLREGFWADIVLFNPDTVEDKAQFGNSKQYPVGIDYVIVNGEVVIDSGEHTGKMPGKVLRYKG